MERRTLEYIVTVTEPTWDEATGRWSATAEIEDEDESETRFHAFVPYLAREKAISAVLESLGRRMRQAVAKADDTMQRKPSGG